MRSPHEQRRNLAQAILHIRSHRATPRRTLADVMSLSPSTAGFYVDQLVGCLHLLFDSGACILHGPLTALGARFYEDIVARAGALVPNLGNRLPKLFASRLADDAGVLGAASLVMEKWQPKTVA